VTHVDPQQRRHDPAAGVPPVGARDPVGDGVSAGGRQPGQPESDAASLLTDEFLRRLAAEMDRLGGLISTVELAVLSGRPAPTSTETLAALQQIDLIAQTIASLSDFLRTVTPVRREERVLVGVGLRLLTLSDLSARLGAAEQDHTGSNLAEGDAGADILAKPNGRPAFGVELF
jgi:hypothetical protein